MTPEPWSRTCLLSPKDLQAIKRRAGLALGDDSALYEHSYELALDSAKDVPVLLREVGLWRDGGLAGVAEVQTILGINTRQQAVQVCNRPDFPLPVAQLRAGRVWLFADVTEFRKRWKRRRGAKAVAPS